MKALEPLRAFVIECFKNDDFTARWGDDTLEAITEYIGVPCDCLLRK